MPMLWGIYNYNSDQIVTKDEMIAMGNAMSGFGQDHVEIRIFGPLGMGHRSSRSTDPLENCSLANEGKTLFLVFDGLISNYDILSTPLVKQKYRFNPEARSPELIVHLYEEYRLKCFEMLNGMFAFTLWDDRAKELFLARDRYGIKPLYYYDDGRSLVFSSHIKPILSIKGVERRLNHQAFYDYLSLNYIPFDQTIFQGIKKVPIRSYIRYSKQDKSTKQYWDFKVEPELKIGQSQIEEELGQKLKVSVKSLLPSDSPVGVFLSGGLDSAAITYCLKELGKEPIETFGISFKQKGYDESGYGKIVADYLGTNHHIVPLGDGFVKDYEKIIAYYENLHGESSMIPFYYLAQAAGKEKNCIFCGESGDELLGGYPEMLADKLLLYYKKIPLMLRRSLLRFLVDRLPVSDAPVSFDYKIKHFIRGAEQEALRAHYYWREVFTEEEKHRLFSRDFYHQKQCQETFERYVRCINRYSYKDMLRDFQLGYLNTLIPDNNLPYYDTLCSAHSIDVRYPFLDNDLVNFMLRIPMSMKLKGTTTKYVLRQFLRDKLPRVIVSRKKHGLSSPVKIWIREEMRDIFMDRLSRANLRRHPYLNAEYVRQLIKEHLDRKLDNSRKLWGLFCFVVWHKEHFGR